MASSRIMAYTYAPNKTLSLNEQFVKCFLERYKVLRVVLLKYFDPSDYFDDDRRLK